MNHNTSDGDFNSNRELEKPSANRAHLGMGAVTVPGLRLDLLQEHVGGGGQQDPELIGQKAAATRPVHREIVLQLLDSVLGIAPLAVELVHILGRHLQIGHDESHVVLRITIGVNHHLSLEDDATFMRMKATKLLASNGYEVVEAATGAEAVESYKTENPDAVLLDITMPDMDGLQALKEIRKIDPNANIAMVTAMGQQSIVMEALKAGAKDFVVKPFDADRVLAAIAKIMA